MTRDVSASKGTGTAEGTGNPRNTVDFDARRRLVEKRSAAALMSEKFVRIGAIREESHESILKRLKTSGKCPFVEIKRLQSIWHVLGFGDRIGFGLAESLSLYH